MDVSFKTGEGIFNYRVCAIIVRQGCLLAMRDEVSPYYYLPGGRVMLHETAEQALLREIREEMNVQGRIVRPLWMAQDFFTEDVKHCRYHELCLYFLVELPTSLPQEPFTRVEGKHTHTFTWLPFEQLTKEYLYPTFIKEKIFTLPEQLELITEIE